MTAPPRRTRFDAYAAGVADGRADRAAGLEEPRDDVGAEWPWRQLAYGAGYYEGFGREQRDARVSPGPLGAELAVAVGESLVGAWLSKTRPRRVWAHWLVAVAAFLALQRLQLRWRRGDVGAPPVLLPPGRVGRNQGVATAWWIMRRRGVLGDGFATRLGRNVAFVIVLRLERRADERRWRDYQTP